LPERLTVWLDQYTDELELTADNRPGSGGAVRADELDSAGAESTICATAPATLRVG
jgi:hypothetical protein